ncbi:MAG: hypothetical protein Ct9H300mP1_37010 [Planctomycetaceae bacterium]|nr:MAG: hypothetical protein Ct9H300mP1_37010 [Planctomycetaceae bacterium]
MREEIGKAIVGQHEIVDQLLVSLFSRGPLPAGGSPGLAKTLLVSTIAEILQLSFRRIQFTPHLMPSDITGTDVLQGDPDTPQRAFHFMQGAAVCQHRARRRDQPNTAKNPGRAAGSDAGTASDRRHKHLPAATTILRLATQNPIEQEGTYTLPEAQLDRFMFHVVVDYPTADEELSILKQTTGQAQPELEATLTGEQILKLQDLVRQVPVADHVFVYARDLARATRPNEPDAPSSSNPTSPGVPARGLALPGHRGQGPRGTRRTIARHDRRHQGGRSPCTQAPTRNKPFPGRQREHHLRRPGRYAAAKGARGTAERAASKVP